MVEKEGLLISRQALPCYNNPMDTYVIIDANNLAHMFFHTLGKFTNRKGQPTGIIYGLTRLLVSVCKEHPDALTFVFDPIPEEIVPVEAGGRHPPEFYHQLLAVTGLLEILAVHYLVAAEEVIADYVVAGVVNWAKTLSPTPLVYLYSNDHDFHQLVDENTLVVRPGKHSEIYDVVAVREKYGLEPRRLPELWALTGDRGDGIPGVRGIGSVKGVKLINEYGGLQGVLTQLEKDVEKYPRAVQDAAAAYALINLLDRTLPEGYAFDPSCTHLYGDLGSRKERLRQFFLEYDFTEYAKKLVAGELFSDA